MKRASRPASSSIESAGRAASPAVRRVAELLQRRHRAGDRGERRAQIVRQRGEQSGAQLLVVLERGGAQRILDQHRAIDRDRGLIENQTSARDRAWARSPRQDRPARSRRRRRRRAWSPAGGTGSGCWAACRSSSPPPRASRTPIAPRRSRRGSSTSSGGQAEASVSSASSGNSIATQRALERLLRIDGRGFEDVVERDGAGKLSRQLEQRSRRARALAARAALDRARGPPASRPERRRSGR